MWMNEPSDCANILNVGGWRTSTSPEVQIHKEAYAHAQPVYYYTPPRNHFEKGYLPLLALLWDCNTKSESAKERASSPPWSVQMDPPSSCPKLERNVSINSNGGSLVFVRKTHTSQEASSIIKRYDEEPSYDRTTLSSILLDLEKLEV